MTRQPRVFISRTTAGLAMLADEMGAILNKRGIEVILQTEFLPDWRTVPQMLQQQLANSDAVIALIGPAHGSEPDYEPARLNDKRTHDRKFSFTQWEYLVARELKRSTYTFIVSGTELITPFDQSDELKERQQQFIADFPMQQSELRYEYTDRQKLLADIAKIEFPLTVVAGKPTNLPHTSLGTLFKGRDEFLAELRQHLTAEGPVVIKGKRTIHGMGGVGKTRAAIEYAWKHADDYRALLFISADTPEALHRNLAALCGPLVLNLPEQNEKEQALQVEAALRWLKLHPGWFLIIDNVDTDEAAEETKALLAKLATGHVLITSRISDWTGHVKSLDLDVLSEAASIAFLDERTEERRPRKDDDREKVAALVQLLDCLALALEQAGAHISTSAISYADYIALWESHRPDALAWHDEEKMKYPCSLAITYETSVTQLSPGAKELFQILSWFAPDPIPRNLLDTRPNPTDEKRHLGEIERLHLARYLGDGKSFAIHRLNQEIARGQQESDVENKSRLLRLLDEATEMVGRKMPRHTDDVQTWHIAVPLVPHAVSIGNQNWDSENKALRAVLLGQAALLYKTKADYKTAEPLYRSELKMFRELQGMEQHIASTLNNLGSLLQATERFAEAENFYEQALAIDEKLHGDSHPTLAQHLNNLADLMQQIGRNKEAEPMMRRVLSIARKEMKPQDPFLARAMSNLGGLLLDFEQIAEAEKLFHESLGLIEQSLGPQHPRLCPPLEFLSAISSVKQRFDEAEMLLRRSLSIGKAAYGDQHPLIAVTLNNIAKLYLDTGRDAEAEPLIREALRIDMAVFGPNHHKVAARLSNLIRFLAGKRRFSEAEPHARHALEIETGAYGPNHPNTAFAMNNLAVVLHQMDREEEVEALSRSALAIYEDIYGSESPKLAVHLNNLATILEDFGKVEQGEPLMKRALKLLLSSFRKSGHQPSDLPTVANRYFSQLIKMGDSQEYAMTKLRDLMRPYGISF